MRFGEGVRDEVRRRLTTDDYASRLDVFQIRIGDFRTAVIGDSHGLPLHILHQAIEVVARRGKADNAHGSSVPQLGCVQFRYRNIEAGTQSILQAAHYVTAVFEGMRRFNAELEGKKGDHSVARQSSVASRQASGSGKEVLNR